jgi:hypothetical protein
MNTITTNTITTTTTTTFITKPPSAPNPQAAVLRDALLQHP